MNTDLNRSATPGRQLDDERLGALVRTVADDWRMPPQRLDQPTWRDRTREGAGRRRPWLARVAGPASAALVATVVLALAAVWLSAPRGDRATVGKSPEPSSTPSASARPTATPLPPLTRNGALPTVTRVLVQADGRFRVADLATGTLGDDSLAAYSGPIQLVPRADGGWLCLCGKWTTFGLNGSTGLTMTLVPVDAGGRASEGTEIRSIQGEVDPNIRADLQFQQVDASITVTADGKTAFFGWTVRNGAEGWTSGIDVIDVASATVVDSVPVPVGRPAVGAGEPVSQSAPNVEISPADDRIVLVSFWFVEEPNNPRPEQGNDRWTATLDGQAIGAIEPLDGAAAADCGTELDSGLIDAASYYLICGNLPGDLNVRRVGLDGSETWRTPIPPVQGEFFGGALVARSGDALFIWEPVGAGLARVDLANGQLTTSEPATAAGAGPLDAIGALGRRLGDWIAPSALAKLLLDPGLVVSPDGSRVYAIGVTSSNPESRGSTGVFAFDAASLERLGQWDPTADFTSIAISADSRFVYASGQGGVNADGVGSRNGASVTVFDASDGSVRLIAGALGSAEIWFANSTLESGNAGRVARATRPSITARAAAGTPPTGCGPRTRCPRTARVRRSGSRSPRRASLRACRPRGDGRVRRP
jgi:hypothetical protein